MQNLSFRIFLCVDNLKLGPERFCDDDQQNEQDQNGSWAFECIAISSFRHCSYPLSLILPYFMNLIVEMFGRVVYLC